MKTYKKYKNNFLTKATIQIFIENILKEGKIETLTQYLDGMQSNNRKRELIVNYFYTGGNPLNEIKMYYEKLKEIEKKGWMVSLNAITSEKGGPFLEMLLTEYMKILVKRWKVKKESIQKRIEEDNREIISYSRGRKGSNIEISITKLPSILLGILEKEKIHVLETKII